MHTSRATGSYKQLNTARCRINCGNHIYNQLGRRIGEENNCAERIGENGGRGEGKRENGEKRPRGKGDTLLCPQSAGHESNHLWLGTLK